MLQPDSPSNPSNIIHQSLISFPTHYESQPFEPYGVDFNNILGSYTHQSHNVGPTIQSLGDRIPISFEPIQAPPMADEPQLNHYHQNHTQESFYSSSSSSLNQASYTCYGTDSPSLSFAGSRYLKPTQSLLEEFVSINEIDLESTNMLYASNLLCFGQHGSLELRSKLKAELYSYGLSMEKQELQATLGKLISLLEEVERRYEQYYQELEHVVSSFESNAGLGSGKSYTALAHNAILGHFSSLKDAILSQIFATRKTIMQDLPKLNTGLSQIHLFDELETNRLKRISIQQLGMMDGPLPIPDLRMTSVIILRSWLFEHFLHPYPDYNEKLLLASQTGLSKNQVTNWFVNARVRLWKPMIEEMYKEEFAGSS